MCCPVARPPRRQRRGCTPLLTANEPAGGLQQRGSAAGEERKLRQSHRGSTDGVSFARDSRRRCPAPHGLMDSVRSVKEFEWSKNACMPLNFS